MKRALPAVLMVALLWPGPGAAQSIPERLDRDGGEGHGVFDCSFAGCYRLPDNWFDDDRGIDRRDGGDSWPPLPDADPTTNADGTTTCTPHPAITPPFRWQDAPIPTGGTIGVNPTVHGMTGLETWYWWTPPDDPPLSVTWTTTGRAGRRADCTTIPAPQRTFTASATQWHWDVGEPARNPNGTYRPPGSVYLTDHPGDESHPAVTHIYEACTQPQRSCRQGGDHGHPYQLSVHVLWQRTNDPTTTITLPAGTRDYHVIEVRTRLH